MVRFFLVITFLLANAAVFSQVKFMAGVSASPNVSVGTFTNHDFNNYSHYAQGYSLGGGANVGLYLCKRFFILTGLERTARTFSFQDKSSNPIYYTNPGFGGDYLKYKDTYHAWEIPLLANLILSAKEKNVSWFLSGGFVGGKTTVINATVTDLNFSGSNYQLKAIGKDITSPYYLDAALGLGCKVKFGEKVSLLVIPNVRYQLTHANYSSMYTTSLRTMLMYNFNNK